VVFKPEVTAICFTIGQLEKQGMGNGMGMGTRTGTGVGTVNNHLNVLDTPKMP